MIRITFEGTTQDVMKEMKEFIDNRAEGVVVEVPKNQMNQGVDPDEPKVGEPKVEAATVPEPTPKEYKLEELQVAMQPLINSKLSELQALLAKYGVPSLVELPKERYPEFAADLRAMGVQI